MKLILSGTADEIAVVLRRLCADETLKMSSLVLHKWACLQCNYLSSGEAKERIGNMCSRCHSSQGFMRINNGCTCSECLESTKA